MGGREQQLCEMRVISVSWRVERGSGRRRGGGREREGEIRSIVEGGTENIRSKPATAGLPPWGVILVCMVNAEAMPKFHEWKIKLLRF